ncbi:MAG: universal stress protein [Calditrichae bacterium]|nr:universal stress protein [Calditrichia bacterium]NIV71920.1 universal stress protein [Calditrichia bacterium]
MNIQKILVPVDFSKFSYQALENALLWGEKFNAELTLLHVNTLFHEHFNYETMVHDCQEIIDKQEEHLHQLMGEQAEEIRDKQVNIQYQILRGRSAAGAILKFISEHHFDLIVIGTHGRTGLSHFLLGSVAEKVARLSPVPVLTIHHSVERVDIKNILVPIDFSNYSGPLVKCAISVGKAFSASLHLLYVHERATAASFKWMVEEIEPQFETEHYLKDQIFKKMSSYLENETDNVIMADIKVGHPYQEIINYADENEIDLIMMATRGFGKFDYFWLWGSTTERVIRLATCPLLTTRHEEVSQLSETEFAEKPDSSELS